MKTCEGAGGTGNTAVVICTANMVLLPPEQQPVLPQQPAPAAALTAAHGALVHIESVLLEIVGHREQVVAQAGAQPLEEGRPVGQGSEREGECRWASGCGRRRRQRRRRQGAIGAARRRSGGCVGCDAAGCVAAAPSPGGWGELLESCSMTGRRPPSPLPAASPAPPTFSRAPAAAAGARRGRTGAGVLPPPAPAAWRAAGHPAAMQTTPTSRGASAGLLPTAWGGLRNSKTGVSGAI